jgi:Flp pilus assembly protein TadG
MARPRFRGRRGTVLLEYLLTLPLLLVLLVGLVDCGQLLLLHAQLDHATREAGNLVSRGMPVDQAWATLLAGALALDLDGRGQMIVTVVAARSAADPQPWVRTQTTKGTRTWVARSRVGTPDGPASIPGVAALPAGGTMVAIEAAYEYTPVIPPPALAALTLPDAVHAVAYF